GPDGGVRDPEAPFSPCFAAPFLPLAPTRYAELLRQKLQHHRCPVWLVNTGWTGGPFGVGRRMSLAHTRALLRSALTGALDGVPFDADPVFGIRIPCPAPEVPIEVLRPPHTWADAAAYDAKAKKLAGLFREKFAKFEGQVTDDVRRAGPRE